VALAISEAFAGSDVSGLQTTAVRDGDYWIVTGTKKYFNFAILGSTNNSY
jgi:alkylation response protein AidB-like acyl-CoA dehydrogenase